MKNKKLKNLEGVNGGFRGNFHENSLIEAKNVLLVDKSKKSISVDKDYTNILKKDSSVVRVSIL